MEKFFGLGEEQSHCRAFSYDTDHPEVFAAADALLSGVPRPCGAAERGKDGDPASGAPGAPAATTRPKRPV